MLPEGRLRFALKVSSSCLIEGLKYPKQFTGLSGIIGCKEERLCIEDVLLLRPVCEGNGASSFTFSSAFVKVVYGLRGYSIVLPGLRFTPISLLLNGLALT